MSAMPSTFSSTEAEYVRLALRTMLAGECPLFSAWGRFEDGAPATHVRCAASYTVPLQTQLVQIAVRHRLHLI